MRFRFDSEPLVNLSCIVFWLTIAMDVMTIDNFPGTDSYEQRILYQRSVRKPASVGGSRVLECDVVYPGGEYVRHIVTWRRQGLEAPIFILFDGYPPHMDTSYHGRIRLVGQASIEINNISTTDEGWYECTVLFLDKSDDTNINGTWLYLSVNSSPVLGKTSPTLLMQKDGETVEMYCEASGSPTPTLTWLKDGKEMRSSDRVTLTGNRVRIVAVNKLDAGLYSCIFKNIVGSTLHVIKLVIQGDGWVSSGNVYITVQPKNTTALEGSRVKLQCHADGYPDNITYQWKRNGFDIQVIRSLSSKAQVLSDGTLIINSVSKDHSGWYTCRPSNNLGIPSEARAYLNVTYYPKVLNMPTRLYLPRGLMGRIDCPVESNPPLTVIVWRKENLAIDYTQLPHMKANKEGTLIIKPVISSDEGQYTCTPYSPLGQGQTSWPVQVFVRDPPYFTYRPKVIYQRQPTQSVTMPCMAQGDPLPLISWRKPDGELPAPSRMIIQGGNMTIVNLGKEDHGMYECVASSVVSSVVTTALLIIELTTPHSPYNVTVETRHDCARISWMPAYDAGFALHYVIWYRFRSVPSSMILSPSTTSRNQWMTLRVIVSNAMSVTIYQLTPDVVYEFMVLSRNRAGDGLFSEAVTAKTKAYSGHWTMPPFTHHPPLLQTFPDDEQRPEKPYNVTVKQNRYGLLISWMGPKNERSSSSSPVSYVVQYRTVGQWVPLVSKLTGKTSFNWTTASRGATYHFRVISYRKPSNGPVSSGDEEMIESLPSDVIVVHTGDPMSEGVKVSDAMIGGAIGGLFVMLILLGIGVAAVRSFRRWRRRRKAFKGHALATSDPDPEQFTENHLDLDTMASTKINTVKETPI